MDQQTRQGLSRFPRVAAPACGVDAEIGWHGALHPRQQLANGQRSGTKPGGAIHQTDTPSSGTATENIRKTVLSNPVLSNIPAIVKLADQLDLLLPLGNPEIEFTRTDANGVVTFFTSDEHIEATHWLVDGKYAATSYYDRPLRFLSKLVPTRIDNR
jgi:hypothetical protein